MSIYTENGFANRRAYLDSVAEDFGLPTDTVYMLAQLLGANEDFDGLITSCEDAAEEMDFE